MNLFELFVKIGVDDQASGNLKSISQKLGNGLKTAAKVGTAAVTAAAAGITALTTAAVNNYAEYEQLVGGVETLFGAGGKSIEEYAASTGRTIAEAQSDYDALMRSQAAVIENASNAYKTAGMSANEYMSTVTGFSAALLRSVGGDTEKAAKLADTAITDMSDNANKMGVSLESLQNAYTGFSRGNFTMLDNLALGFSGTKEGMQELLDTAKELSGVEYDIESYADIVEAIHVVQTEMGITGTTALEAGRTISGSVGAMKSAWTNLLTGLADGNADVGELVNNLVTTIVGDGSEENLGVFGNIMPAVQTALTGASTLISELLPQIVQTIPTIITENLPILAEAAVSIIQSLVDGISGNQEMLFEPVFGVITFLAESFITMLPQIVQLGFDLVVSLASGISENMNELVATVFDLVQYIVDAIIENAPELANAAFGIVDEFGNALAEQIPGLSWVFENLESVIVGVTTALATLKITMAMSALIGGLTKAWQAYKTANEGATVAQWLLNAAQNANPMMLVITLVAGLVAAIVTLWNTNEGFREAVIKVWDGIKNAFSSAWDFVVDLWGQAGDFFAKIWSGIKKAFGSVTDWFRNTFSKAWTAVKNVFSTGGKIFSGIKDGIASVFKTVVNAIIRGINTVISVPFNAINKMLRTLRDVSILGVEPFGWIKEFSVPQIPELWRGGVLERGQIGLLEGSGAEAVVPLENNKKWISKVAKDMKNQLNSEGQTFGRNGVYIVQHIRSEAKTAADLMLQARYQAEQAVFLSV